MPFFVYKNGDEYVIQQGQPEGWQLVAALELEELDLVPALLKDLENDKRSLVIAKLVDTEGEPESEQPFIDEDPEITKLLITVCSAVSEANAFRGN